MPNSSSGGISPESSAVGRCTLARVSEPDVQPPASQNAPRLWLVALAAVAALALAAPWMLHDEPPAGTILLTDPTLVGDRRVRLSWRARAGVPRYLVEVKSLDLIPRFNGTSETTSIDLPFDVSGEILNGASFVWSVTQVDEDGKPTGTSAVEPLMSPER